MDNNLQHHEDEALDSLLSDFMAFGAYKKGVKHGLIGGLGCIGVGALATLVVQKVIKKPKKKKSKEN
jgi:hypothetical protein